eukprot:TRINITY_DN63071_c0_g1_i1.p1 TRINITY_DN63071_c0_g1~~TRINITY_DN63071_c0_g1_i1.p1  ORF type:complete len:685 (+),score=64.53 TRINITY_DN63071_c0_g1_i1:65-2119(+)
MVRASTVGALLFAIMRAVRSRTERGLGCTAFAIGGAATVDGAAYAGMNADCSSCDPRLNFVPATYNNLTKTRPLYIFKGTAPRWVGYGRGKLYEPRHGEKLTPQIGAVAGVPRTYGYWEGVLPIMNEVGLVLGESSCAARLMNYPKGQAPTHGDPRTGKQATEGVLDLPTMMQLALERCETAKCAVKVMGSFAEELGFFPQVGEWSLGRETITGKAAFDDGGEAVTLADRSGDAWVYHVVGGVTGVAKSVWAAMRVPTGHAAFVANSFILREVPESESDDWLFSSKLRDVALAAGLWNGVEPLDFARTFAPDHRTFETPAGEAPIPLYASLRIWRLFGLVAPSAWRDRVLPQDALTLPISVAAERPLRRRDVFGLLSDLYEDTEFDLSQGILAGPFGNPFRPEGGDATRYIGQLPRGISIARTVYSAIGQSRPRGEPVLWIAPDTPAASVYVPFYLAAGDCHAASFSVGTLAHFTRDSAFWAFNFVANWAAQTHWLNASKQFVLPARAKLQREIEEAMPVVEAKAVKDGPRALVDWQVETQRSVVERWWALADNLVVVYNDGFYNDPKTNTYGQSLGYTISWARMIGFNQDVHPIFVKRDWEHTSVRSRLPDSYDFTTATWVYSSPSMKERPRSHSAIQLMSMLAALFIGVGIGRISAFTCWHRRSARSDVYDGRPLLISSSLN